MKFGFMQDFRNPRPWCRPFPELYKLLLAQIVRAEELGYNNAWLTEQNSRCHGKGGQATGDSVAAAGGRATGSG
jgi:hypothetical protein